MSHTLLPIAWIGYPAIFAFVAILGLLGWILSLKREIRDLRRTVRVQNSGLDLAKTTISALYDKLHLTFQACREIRACIVATRLQTGGPGSAALDAETEEIMRRHHIPPTASLQNHPLYRL